MPQGWHFKEESKSDTRAFFITQEDIDRKGEFETGLTLNVAHLKQDKAQEYAAAFIAELGQSPGHELQDTWQTETGVVKGLEGVFERPRKATLR